MTDTTERERVVDLMRSSPIAMLTHVDASGALVSHPMATQDVDPDGALYFIAERDSQKVQELEQRPAVNVSYSNRGSWVSVAGAARIVNDEAKLRELWDTFTSSWLEGGPENPNNVLIEVHPDTAEYWDAPGGSKVTQLVNLVKAKTTGSRIEADNSTVDL